jgi:hypothetical protein
MFLSIFIFISIRTMNNYSLLAHFEISSTTVGGMNRDALDGMDVA